MKQDTKEQPANRTSDGEAVNNLYQSWKPQTLSDFVPLQVRHVIRLFWLFTKDDAATFVGPNTVFGICGALAGPVLISQRNEGVYPWTLIAFRLPAVVFFNWSNLLIFDLANQRLPESVLEDTINKPWRPAPSGLMTSEQIRQAMLLLIPAVWASNWYCCNAASETALLMVLTWLYNDLMGGDESWILRNTIIAAAFGLYNLGSIRVASGQQSSASLTPIGVAWILIISGVIWTTMHVQDLKDQQGDRSRGRRSAPLVLGDRCARWTIAIPVVFWSLVCTYFWEARIGGTWGLTIVALGLFVAFRCLAYDGASSDRLTWQLWAAWTAAIYVLPCMHARGVWE
ncbi:UbiA prenyltransferase family-domain-containing protein [Astrocystis sublimbata]|nr:UbiA prenyltransferase family-domain-containing protein [Astrocystis sublimbata]